MLDCISSRIGSMTNQTPAEKTVHWLGTPGTSQSLVRWGLLVPGIVCIFIVIQLSIFLALSLFAMNSNSLYASWEINMLNAACVPYFIIRYCTVIAPSQHRRVSVVMAIVAVIIVALFRLASELSHPDAIEGRAVWIAVGALVCGTSVWFGVRGVWQRQVLR